MAALVLVQPLQKGRVSSVECEPFMNKQSSTWNAGNIRIWRRGRRGGRYSLDDRRVEAVEAAVQSDSLKEKQSS